jgi:hypothetical protein
MTLGNITKHSLNDTVLHLNQNVQDTISAISYLMLDLKHIQHYT